MGKLATNFKVIVKVTAGTVTKKMQICIILLISTFNSIYNFASKESLEHLGAYAHHTKLNCNVQSKKKSATKSKLKANFNA